MTAQTTPSTVDTNRLTTTSPYTTLTAQQNEESIIYQALQTDVDRLLIQEAITERRRAVSSPKFLNIHDLMEAVRDLEKRWFAKRSSQQINPQQYTNQPELTNVIREINNTENEVNSCKVCFDAERNCWIYPCHHVLCCTVCVLKLRTCPVCRTEFLSAVRIYLA